VTRRGFTLLELVVAIMLTGIVALLVYGAARAALDARAEALADDLARWREPGPGRGMSSPA